MFTATPGTSWYRRIGFLTGLLLLAATAGVPALAGPPTIAGCQVFPGDNIWNTMVDDLPLHPLSATFIDTIGPQTVVHPDFGSGQWDGGPIGIPSVVVPGNQPKVAVSFDYADQSDPGPYPIPPDAPIEGGSGSSGDRHVLVLDQEHCLLYETWSSYPAAGGSWQAGSGAIFDLSSNLLRPDSWTSADAAGLPILPGLVRYDEVAAGEITHALRFTAPQTRREYVWPGRHYASNLTASSYPPMGLRFRLRKDFDISGFSSPVKTILTALKQYGMILADNGSAWYLSGVPDPHWDDDTLVTELRRLKGADFEALDSSSLMVNSDSGQTAGAAAVPAGNLPDGDLDGDHFITIADALRALRITVNLLPQTDSDLLHGDVAPRGTDGKSIPDGFVNVQDALTILRAVVGLISIVPGPPPV